MSKMAGQRARGRKSVFGTLTMDFLRNADPKLRPSHSHTIARLTVDIAIYADDRMDLAAGESRMALRHTSYGEGDDRIAQRDGPVR